MEKLKSFLANDAWFTAVLLILVGVVAFGLGRHSVVGQTAAVVGGAAALPPPLVTLTERIPLSAENAPEAAISTSNTTVVASKSGTKYHLPTCPGAKQMKEDNKIWFDSVELAEAAGYSPAANCPGL